MVSIGEKINLDVGNISNFRYDAERCVGCKGCVWVDHIYMPGVEFGTRCPSLERYSFDAYAAYGREKIILGLLNGKYQYTDTLLDSIYRCSLCGACDAGCKRNLDLEPLLFLEAARIKCVSDGKGPMPEHKKIARNINRTHNRYGSPHANRSRWLTQDIKPAAKADVIYFVGCNASYVHTEIAQATARILGNNQFMLLGSEEWCCGYPLYSTGQLDAFKKQVEHNLDFVKKSGASTVLVSCAEGYKTWKVDYPKVLGKSTGDMGFKVMHLVEYVDQMMKEGKLKFTNPLNMRLTYHDSCNLGRLSEPWTYWEGTRGKWGVTQPPKPMRRGTNGIYGPPREILKAIPGVNLVEMARMRENAWCCGAGAGVRDAFKDFALWSAGERLTEAKTTGAEAIVVSCPYCKDNLGESIKARDEKIKVYDISELVARAIEK